MKSKNRQKGENMTRQEYERLAIGIETGYTDRMGNPIKVGDNIILYNKVKEYVGKEYIDEYYKDEYIVGTGYEGYVYTGKIMRQYHTVTFSFENGLQMTSTGKYKFLRERDEYGNLLTVLIGDKSNAPKLTFEELLKSGIRNE